MEQANLINLINQQSKAMAQLYGQLQERKYYYYFLLCAKKNGSFCFYPGLTRARSTRRTATSPVEKKTK